MVLGRGVEGGYSRRTRSRAVGVLVKDVGLIDEARFDICATWENSPIGRPPRLPPLP